MQKIIVSILLLLLGSPGYGATQDEIDHLLVFVETSNCVFIRNGNEYSGADAVSHINRKYKYFEDDIDSAEKFIQLSATKSTRTSQPYYIECPGTAKIQSSTWLLLELGRYRSDANI